MRILSFIFAFSGYLLLAAIGMHGHDLSLIEIGSCILGTFYASDLIRSTVQHGAQLVEKGPAYVIGGAYAIKAPLVVANDWEALLYSLACGLLALGYLLAIIYHVFGKRGD